MTADAEPGRPALQPRRAASDLADRLGDVLLAAASATPSDASSNDATATEIDPAMAGAAAAATPPPAAMAAYDPFIAPCHLSFPMDSGGGGGGALSDEDDDEAAAHDGHATTGGASRRAASLRPAPLPLPSLAYPTPRRATAAALPILTTAAAARGHHREAHGRQAPPAEDAAAAAAAPRSQGSWAASLTRAAHFLSEQFVPSSVRSEADDPVAVAVAVAVAAAAAREGGARRPRCWPIDATPTPDGLQGGADGHAAPAGMTSMGLVGAGHPASASVRTAATHLPRHAYTGAWPAAPLPFGAAVDPSRLSLPMALGMPIHAAADPADAATPASAAPMPATLSRTASTAASARIAGSCTPEILMYHGPESSYWTAEHTDSYFLVRGGPPAAAEAGPEAPVQPQLATSLAASLTASVLTPGAAERAVAAAARAAETDTVPTSPNRFATIAALEADRDDTNATAVDEDASDGGGSTRSSTPPPPPAAHATLTLTPGPPVLRTVACLRSLRHKDALVALRGPDGELLAGGADMAVCCATTTTPLLCHAAGCKGRAAATAAGECAGAAGRTPSGHAAARGGPDVEALADRLMALPYATPPRGSCTLAQTAFNAINMLLGIGVLAMPFAFRIAGWGGGLLLTWLLLAVTRYTALLIGRIMDTAVIQRADGRYTGVMSYADLGFVAFGRVGHTLIGSLFMMELFGASVALLILSADSFAVLWPEVAVVHIKWLIFGVMVVTTIPRRFNIFGYTSLLGIVALVNLACILIYNGLAYDGVPGSLRHPAPTTWLPPQWFPVPLTFGLVMAGYCSHSVFPSMYREMAQPAEYPRVVNIAYAVTGLFTMLIAVAGYLMFGDQTLEEITLNLATVNGYPRRLTALAVFLIGVNPLTKFGLTVNPIAQNLEAWLARCCAQRGGPLRRPRGGRRAGVLPWLRHHLRRLGRLVPWPYRRDAVQLPSESSDAAETCGLLGADPASCHVASASARAADDAALDALRLETHRWRYRLPVRTALAVAIVVTACYFPGFHQVMALLGSLLAFTISVMTPCIGWWRLAMPAMARREQAWLGFCLVLSVIGIVLGTAWAILPLHLTPAVFSLTAAV